MIAGVHAWLIGLQIVCIGAVALATLHDLREARRAARVERALEARRVHEMAVEREGWEHALTLAQIAREHVAAHSLSAEIETWPTPLETFR